MNVAFQKQIFIITGLIHADPSHDVFFKVYRFIFVAHPEFDSSIHTAGLQGIEFGTTPILGQDLVYSWDKPWSFMFIFCDIPQK